MAFSKLFICICLFSCGVLFQRFDLAAKEAEVKASITEGATGDWGWMGTLIKLETRKVVLYRGLLELCLVSDSLSRMKEWKSNLQKRYVKDRKGDLSVDQTLTDS